MRELRFLIFAREFCCKILIFVGTVDLLHQRLQPQLAPSATTHPPPTLKPHPSLTLAVPPEFERDGPSTCRASRQGRSETIGERGAYLPSMLTLHHSPRTAPLSHLLWSLSRYATR